MITIKADITLESGQTIWRYFSSWKDIAAWIDRHHGHIAGVDAKLREMDGKGVKENEPCATTGSPEKPAGIQAPES